MRFFSIYYLQLAPPSRGFSNFPRFERNMNTGGNNFDESVGVVAHTQIHHSKKYPSVVRLPIVKK